MEDIITMSGLDCSLGHTSNPEVFLSEFNQTCKKGCIYKNVLVLVNWKQTEHSLMRYWLNKLWYNGMQPLKIINVVEFYLRT